MHRSVFDKVNYDDEQVDIFLDLDFKIRASALFEVVYSGEPLVEYRIHDKGIHNVPFDRLFRDYVSVLIKNLELVRFRCDGDSRVANQLVADRIYEWVRQILSESNERSMVLEKLDSEYKRILHEAEKRMGLINRLDSECAQLREANHQLHDTCDERLWLIENLEKVAIERLEIIQRLEAECSDLRRKNAELRRICDMSLEVLGQLERAAGERLSLVQELERVAAE